MASVIELKHGGKKNGRRAVQFTAPNGDRPVIRLGKVSKADAENWRTHVDHLVAAAAANRAPDWSTVQWVEALSPKHQAKLAGHGLIAAREQHKAIPLAEFLQGYVDKRKDLKTRTRTNLEQAKGKLVEFFKADKNLRTITKGHAKDWRRWLGEKLSPATVATHVKKARQFFQDAVDHKLIAENPFAGVKAGKQTNPKRQEYVSAAVVRKVIDACHGTDWRTLFALARFGGLRVPSETSILTWPDVEWERDRLKVRSPKTEHHEGRDFRWVPIFPELRPYLEAARAEAGPGATRVLASLRTTNPRTTASKAVKRAEVKTWPKLFQNLRSSCQTDLEHRGFTTHVVCAWLGNTPKVAHAHYLQVTDDDFQAAAKSAAKSGAEGSGNERNLPRDSSDFLDIPGYPEQSQYPQGGSQPPSSALDRSESQNQAQRKALQNDLSTDTRSGRMARNAGRGPDLRQSLSKIARAARGGAR